MDATRNRRIPGWCYFTIVQYWTEVHREVRLQFNLGEDSGGGGSCNDLERYLPRNAFAASWAAPIQPRMRGPMGPANDRIGYHAYPAGRLRAHTTTLGINEIGCGSASALNQIHEPQCQLRFDPHLALINVQSFKRSGDPGQVGG